jgi:hypothetical protein
MADDWAKEYLSTYKQKQQQKQQKRANAQKKADLAEAGAPDIFQRIRDRIEQDLRTFHDGGELQNLQMVEEYEAGEFAVSSVAPSPTAGLHVKLSRVLIEYSYYFPAKGKKSEGKCGTLRIAAELDGEITVYKNGDSFADEAEVSEFLLNL